MMNEDVYQRAVAEVINGRASFTVWSPGKNKMILHLVHPFDKKYEMKGDEQGWWHLQLEGIEAGTLYYYQPDGERDLPDPASRSQPHGVHGPSELIDQDAYQWHDENWKGLSLEEYIIYELHVGTFTPEGNFEAIIPRLQELKKSGFTAIELMPVAQFPGDRNWGYDGVFPYAVQNSYGGPQALKKLVGACHENGMAVIMDVVYNHIGPEGNYLSFFAPYFSGRYHTLWGDAINFDWEWSDAVRSFFIENTLYWLRNFHIDALRYDAIHAIFDFSPVHFWEELRQEVNDLKPELGRQVHLIAESDLNDPRVLDPITKRGFGFDAQWLDDFHHALYKILHPEDQERYNDFGSMKQLATSLKDGFVHSGQEWVRTRKRSYGGPSTGFAGNRFIAFHSNHDQAGNRPDGARPCMFLDHERMKLAAATLLLSPYIPLIFMGDEYGDDTPFYYFVSHSDEELVEAVRKGRKEEFKDAGFNTEPPDAQSEKTFQDSVLVWDKRKKGNYKIILQWYELLIDMRKTVAPLQNFEKKDLDAAAIGEEALVLTRRSRDGMETLTAYFNFSDREVAIRFPGEGNGKKLLDSKESRWMEPGKSSSIYPSQLEGGQSIFLQPLSVVVYHSGRGKNIES